MLVPLVGDWGVSKHWTGFSGMWDLNVGLDYRTGMWDWNMKLVLAPEPMLAYQIKTENRVKVRQGVLIVS